MDARFFGTILGTFMLLGSGCIDRVPTPETAHAETPPQVAPYVVVATMDGGVNPYHQAYQRNTSLPDELLARFNANEADVGPVRIKLSNVGSFEERVVADRQIWQEMKPGVLYYYEGTNVLSIIVANDNKVTRSPLYGSQTGYAIPGSYHGNGVLGSVMRAAPEAILVMVAGYSAEGEAWVAGQAWIDIYSMSYGSPSPDPYTSKHLYGVNPSSATKIMTSRGMLALGAAGNVPQPPCCSDNASPPWVIPVGGSYPTLGCVEAKAGYPELMAAYQFDGVPKHDSVDRTTEFGGTSGATPTVAGVAAKGILDVRRAWNHTIGIVGGALALGPDGQRLTNQEVRHSLHLVARYFSFNAACSPVTGASSSMAPVNDAAPWIQMGWGSIEPSMADGVRDHLLGKRTLLAKPDAAVKWNDAILEVRRHAWSGLA